ncbi:MAG: hypothetical protein DYG93_08375 [Leptolyngbya sp. PLA2]|nr:hypothetical protein [Leptolyngbya sp.]MCE7971662.1 hypothetical protein [Leptolyngbya sp. PL-A2]
MLAPVVERAVARVAVGVHEALQPVPDQFAVTGVVRVINRLTERELDDELGAAGDEPVRRNRPLIGEPIGQDVRRPTLLSRERDGVNVGRHRRLDPDAVPTRGAGVGMRREQLAQPGMDELAIAQERVAVRGRGLERAVQHSAGRGVEVRG